VFGKLTSIVRMLGPGLITGSSDDDPSGIAAYSQVGAQFGYAMLWTMVLSYPLMAAIQEVSARVGRVTGGGISANLRRHYPPWLLYLVVTLVLAANIFNLGADLGAVAAAAQLLLPARGWIYIIGFGATSLLLQILVPYKKYANYLKWLTLSLFAYIATAFYVQIDWREAVHSSLIPQLAWSRSYLTGIIAVFGTTISPYLFFWQASQEVEEVKTGRGEKALKRAPRQARPQLERIRIDTYIGMALSNIVAFFIILTSAATLHVQGVADVSTATQAAKALAPLAGRWAEALFACGIIGTGMLAIPVLAGSAGYAIGEARKWPASLERQPEHAIQFYVAISIASLAGVCLNFLNIDPIRALFWAAVLNGMLAGPLMAVIMHLASSQRVMERFAVPRYLRVVGWSATAVMLATSVATLAMWIRH
jgi:NRAMP (natural resistance-associated macrophage protein)-like metal ion transporter